MAFVDQMHSAVYNMMGTGNEPILLRGNLQRRASLQCRWAVIASVFCCPVSSDASEPLQCYWINYADACGAVADERSSARTYSSFHVDLPDFLLRAVGLLISAAWPLAA